MTTQLELFNQPKARATDPETSREAAVSVEQWVQDDALLTKFAKYGPLTDSELAAVSPAWHEPTLISARGRLKKRGLVEDSGERRKSPRGRNQIVWALTKGETT